MSQSLIDLLIGTLIGVVGFFVGRVIRKTDKNQATSIEFKYELKILKKDLQRLADEMAVSKRDQTSIWRKIDQIRKGSCDDLNPPKSRQ